MDIEKVGKAIAYLRKRARYTQKELADRIGISDKAVSKWERGQGLPEIGYLRKLCILLDTDPDSLLAGDVGHHKSDWKGIILLDSNQYGIGPGTIIYDKPLIYFLLSYYLLVGIKDIYIGCTLETDADFIINKLGSGSEYGVKIKTVVGTVRDVDERIKEDSVSQDDSASIMMLYGRMILYGVDQTRFFQKAMADRTHLTILALPKKLGQNSISIDVEKKIVNSHQMKLRTQYDFSELPVLMLPEKMLSSLSEAQSINSFLEQRKAEEDMYVEMLDRGFVEIEIDNWNNVQEASAFMKIVQDKCGMNVYCLEEVAWRRGFITLEQLKRHGERQSENEYGEYILSLCRRIEEQEKN